MRTSLACLAAALSAVVASQGVARAHFKLVAPESMITQSTLGDPQKGAPCGPNGAVTPNGMLTVAKPGSMLTVSIQETITHPGHYRVALAPNVAGLPDAPVVTPVGGDQCGSTTIDPNPTLPVLADGIFAHTSAFPAGSVQTVQVQLPQTECNNCVLQVIQYMKNHGAPCFYYHCAAITISNDAPDAGPTGGDAGLDPGTDPAGGCCGTGGAPSSLALAALLGAVVLRKRRR
ncbi:MAG: lytic polysaccharide monooxygenase [Deltaproteobacteria bacterium]|nr:lytic polysaccharide monooxygenase [Deltaproteobacteria bacterium]MCW5807571.1 lytic polysaccharide monooxygenase [Deltaproteobacteria bacterium]